MIDMHLAKLNKDILPEASPKRRAGKACLDALATDEHIVLRKSQPEIVQPYSRIKKNNQSPSSQPNKVIPLHIFS